MEWKWKSFLVSIAAIALLMAVGLIGATSHQIPILNETPTRPATVQSNEANSGVLAPAIWESPTLAASKKGSSGENDPPTGICNGNG
jgi:hypothetical protein